MTKTIHSPIHPSPYLYLSHTEWMWLAAGGGKKSRVECCWARQSSPIRLIFKWLSKQRLPRQQLAGDLTATNLFCRFDFGSSAYCPRGMRAAHGGESMHALHKHMCTQDDWWINNRLTCKPFSSMHICAHKVRSTDINCCKNYEFICLHGAKINCIFHRFDVPKKPQTYPVKLPTVCIYMISAECFSAVW